VLERQPHVARDPPRHRAGGHVEHLELPTLGVEQQHRDRVEIDEPRQAVGEGAQHVVEQVARAQQARDLGQHRGAQRTALPLPDLLDRGPQLTPEAPRQRRALERSSAANQRQSADGPSRGAERDLHDVTPDGSRVR